MKESRFLEFKSEITNTFLKTVSAFSNIGTGTIKFGYNDNGSVCGLKGNINDICLDLENKINDSISPKVNFKFYCNYKNNTIDLIVFEGLYKPYMYKSKAYKRNDSSTIEMDLLELQRTILEGKSISFENLDTDEKLSFNILTSKLKSIIDVDLNKDILKTLGLVNSNGKYNNAALILSDNNILPGIDVIRFGNDINEIMDRATAINVSIFKQYDIAYEMYKKYYEYEVIDGPNRRIVNIIPENAFREALANALIHRTWDDSPNVRIAMFKDKIEITSPGGLLHNISKDEYLDGQVSILRNQIIANVFFRLRYIEMFGTGILRIRQMYQEADFKPEFKIYDNSITIVLPSLNIKPIVTNDENIIVEYLRRGIQASSGDLVNVTGFTKDKVLRLIKSLQSKGFIKITGIGKSTKYSI